VKSDTKLCHYRRATTLAVPRQAAFDWHTYPGAFERLSPPWQPARIESRAGKGLAPGATVTLRVKVGPFWLPWVAEHGEWDPGYMFSDRQVTGPFTRWEHRFAINCHWVTWGCLAAIMLGPRLIVCFRIVTGSQRVILLGTRNIGVHR
jgi:hypothetical protein